MSKAHVLTLEAQLTWVMPCVFKTHPSRHKSGKQAHRGGSKGYRVCKDAVGNTGTKKGAMFKRLEANRVNELLLTTLTSIWIEILPH